MNDGIKFGHDVVIGDFTSIMHGTGICGCCVIGKEVNIGEHAFIIPGRKIEDKSRISAGNIVFTNVEARTSVLGNPTRRIKEME